MIEVKRKMSRPALFRDLPVPSVFIPTHGSEYYIKVEKHSSGEYTFNAVTLVNGQMTNFEHGDEVIQINGSFVED